LNAIARKVCCTLLLAAVFLGLSLHADASFEQILSEIEAIGWSGSARLEELAEQAGQELGESPTLYDRIRLAVALAPLKQRRLGYVEARAELIRLLGDANSGSAKDSLVPRLRLAIAEVAMAEGNWGYALRQLIEARRLLDYKRSVLLSETILHGAELSLLAGLPHVAGLLLAHEAPLLKRMNGLDAYRLQLIRSQIHFLEGDYVAMSLELERFLDATDTDMPEALQMRYFNQRAWGSMAVNSLRAARQFIEAAQSRMRLMDAPLVAAELDFTEAVLLHLEGASYQEVEIPLRRAQEVFESHNQIGYFLGLYQRVLRYPGMEKLSERRNPFLLTLTELPDRGLHPASQALRLTALAESWAADELDLPTNQSVEQAYREAVFIQNEFRQSFLGLCRDWLLISHEQYPGSFRSAPSGETRFYIWILVLSLVIVVLILLLRFRAQRHLNEELEKLVEKAFDAEQAAEASNRLKSQFLANVSHEIRAPLSGLVGMASILDEVIDDPKSRHYVETIRDCSENLSVLMNDLIDLSRIEAGRVEIEERPFALRQFVESNLNLIRDSAVRKGLALGWSFVGDRMPEALLGDRVRIGQVLSNLLQNAVKFTESGSISLEVNFERGEAALGILQLRVMDTGSGIEPDRQRLVFEPFSKGPENEQDNTRGSGLGLAICDRLVDLMGGSIQLQSQVGKGSVFTVQLPLKETDFDA
jgi:signal transduction histidine kinase